jgi:hypothetical protein
MAAEFVFSHQQELGLSSSAWLPTTQILWLQRACFFPVWPLLVVHSHQVPLVHSHQPQGTKAMHGRMVWAHTDASECGAPAGVGNMKQQTGHSKWPISVHSRHQPLSSLRRKKTPRSTVWLLQSHSSLVCLEQCDLVYWLVPHIYMLSMLFDRDRWPQLMIDASV